LYSQKCEPQKYCDNVVGRAGLLVGVGGQNRRPGLLFAPRAHLNFLTTP
jgi:hypothetical protein